MCDGGEKRMVASSKDLGIVAGVGIIVYLISKAGKDLFGALPALDAGLQESISNFQSSLSSFQFPDLSSLIPTVSADEDIIPQDPTEQTAEQQIELFGEELTQEQAEEITIIDATVQAGETVVPAEVDPILLNQFNPEGVFGFGVLGQGNQGISEELAKELGIFDFTVDDLTADQIFRLSVVGEGITDIATIFELSPTREDILFSEAFDIDRPVG